MMMKAVFLLWTCLLLTGCATLSREQCQRGDWFDIGSSDGLAGQPLSRLEQHQRACGEYGIPVDQQQYFSGHAQGLQDYCQLDNAFRSGLEGNRYQGVCPPAIDAAFERANRTAYQVYRLRKELDQVEDQLRQNERRLRDYDLSDDNRRRIRSDLRDLDRERGRLQNDLYESEQDLDRLRHEADLYHRR